jgi:hypothetical protein
MNNKPAVVLWFSLWIVVILFCIDRIASSQQHAAQPIRQGSAEDILNDIRGSNAVQKLGDNDRQELCRLAHDFTVAAIENSRSGYSPASGYKSYSDFGWTEACRFVRLSRSGTVEELQSPPKPEVRDKDGYYPSEYENGHDGKLRTGPAKEWWNIPGRYVH